MDTKFLVTSLIHSNQLFQIHSEILVIVILDSVTLAVAAVDLTLTITVDLVEDSVSLVV